MGFFMGFGQDTSVISASKIQYNQIRTTSIMEDCKNNKTVVIGG